MEHVKDNIRPKAMEVIYYYKVVALPGVRYAPMADTFYEVVVCPLGILTVKEYAMGWGEKCLSEKIVISWDDLFSSEGVEWIPLTEEQWKLEKKYL